jgi:hypothetical protein
MLAPALPLSKKTSSGLEQRSSPFQNKADSQSSEFFNDSSLSKRRPKIGVMFLWEA